MQTSRNLVWYTSPISIYLTARRYNDGQMAGSRWKRTTGAMLLIAIAGMAQRGRFQEREEDDTPMPPREAEFHFLRVEYTDLPEFHRRWGWSSRDGQGVGWG